MCLNTLFFARVQFHLITSNHMPSLSHATLESIVDQGPRQLAPFNYDDEKVKTIRNPTKNR